jgi:PPOX class probable F420-dependent enzyme
LTPEQARSRFAAARVARLATLGPSGPHLVPVCFAVEEDVVVVAVDDVKPKSGRLQRLRNVERDPRVALLADHYCDEDWSRLWWVRADGDARVLPVSPHAVDLLSARYPQYAAAPPPGPVIEVAVRRWSGWAAAG